MLFAAAAPAPAAAWGREGHEIIAAIARTYLAPQTRITVDAMLAQDPDSLSGRGMVDAASWADDYRDQHRETSAWHYVDLELDGPDLKSACHGEICSSASDKKIGKYHMYGTISAIGLGVGVAGLGTGLLLLLTEPEAEDHASAGLRVRPLLGLGVLGAEGTFQ